MTHSIHGDIERVYEEMEGDDTAEGFFGRHGVESLGILTVTDAMTGRKEAETLFYHILNKVVVEVGAGVGWLAIEMAKYAKQVYAIEVDPAWSWVFVRHLYKKKPKNLTWIFGAASEVADFIKADVAVIYTRSGQEAMASVARRMAPKVVFGPRLP